MPQLPNSQREARLGSQWLSGWIVCTKSLVYPCGRAEVPPSAAIPQQHAQTGSLSFLPVPGGHERARAFPRSRCQRGPRHHAVFQPLSTNPQVFNKLPTKLEHNKPPLFFSTQRSSVPSSELCHGRGESWPCLTPLVKGCPGALCCSQVLSCANSKAGLKCHFRREGNVPLEWDFVLWE